MIERWKPVEIEGSQYPYHVSDLGRVRNIQGLILKPYMRGQNKGNYPCVKLYRKGVKTVIDVHRLVALHYVPNPENKPEVNHLDLDHMNPAAYNLEWCTRIENMQHRYFMEAHLSLEEVEIAV